MKKALTDEDEGLAYWLDELLICDRTDVTAVISVAGGPKCVVTRGKLGRNGFGNVIAAIGRPIVRHVQFIYGDNDAIILIAGLTTRYDIYLQIRIIAPFAILFKPSPFFIRRSSPTAAPILSSRIVDGI